MYYSLFLYKLWRVRGRALYTEARKVCNLVSESQPGYHKMTMTPAGILNDLHKRAGAGTVDNTV